MTKRVAKQQEVVWQHLEELQVQWWCSKGAFQGAGKGIKKGMREELLASGVFSEHEVTKLIWNEFDTDIEENYRAMRNPEKYEAERDKKLERDKPYHKRSRAARMADPDRGINSPAFKKFMADRGMSV